jgi:hypothetical protein
MQISKEDMLLAAGIAVTSVLVGAGIAYFMKKTPGTVSDRAVRKAATPKDPLELTPAQRATASAFHDLFLSVPTEVKFDRSWHSGVPSDMLGALHHKLAPGAYQSKDAAGRRIVILESAEGVTHIAYQRFAGDLSPIETYRATIGKADDISFAISDLVDALAEINKVTAPVSGTVEPSTKAA